MVKEASGWIDISVPLRNGMVHWPGDPGFSIERTEEIGKEGAHANLSNITMGSHSGTHVDAPCHFIPGEKGVDRMPLDVAVGPARIIEISDPESIKPAEQAQYRIRSGERILYKTRSSSYVWKSDKFIEEYVYISPEAADFLAGLKLKLVGVDYLSVGGYKKDGAYVHQALLGSGMWLVEGLDLSGTQAGDYDLICLPLRIIGADGAPARTIVKPRTRG
ncbi:MAG: cyclase family protein [Dehalococcoidales bacterium]|nr:cyclase family protein [Dehalococcoidales bacterium]